jgi:glucose/arabinose dehydrogenase
MNSIINNIGSLVFLVFLSSISLPIFASEQDGPMVNDPGLKAEVVYEGLNFPTSMAFLGPDDILVLEKDTGAVRRIVDGTMLNEPLLDVNVANDVERGLLGIAIANNSRSTTYVFLYYTEAEQDDGGEALGNRLYRYELEDNELKNAALLLDLPPNPGSKHEGGAIAIGPDNNVYVAVGDISGQNDEDTKTKAQNFENGPDPDGRAGILRVTQNGQVVNGTGILGDKHPLDMYYAYGIRNSFGIDFDPVTGNLWDTENGPWYGDEINLVEPGFNSGWMSVQGLWNPEENERGNMELNPNLVDFDGRGKYSPPEFIWNNTVGPSALKFFSSNKYGEEYKNDMFVGDVNPKYIYHFDLSNDRRELSLDNSLADKIADNLDELHSIVFAEGFKRITDLEVGPDGYLYILSHTTQEDPSQQKGTIFRITPK